MKNWEKVNKDELDDLYINLVNRLRDAAKMSEALAVLLPNSNGSATAKLYNEAADVIEELSAKQMQMKAIKINTNEYFCPNCGTDMISHKIEVKGNCTVCGKTLGEKDSVFLCAECQKKNNEG